jgi:hypothetical protein
MKDLLQDAEHTMVLEDVKMPHSHFCNPADLGDEISDEIKALAAEKYSLFWSIYHLYAYQGDQTQYPNHLTDAIFVNIPINDVRVLERATQIHLITDKLKLDFDLLSEQFKADMTVAMKQVPEQGWFVKLSSTSSKNEFKLKPIYTEHELYHYLTNSTKFLAHYQRLGIYGFEQEMSVLFVPWNSKICGEKEFRAFLQHGKLVAITQQNSYMQYNPRDYEPVAESIMQVVDTLSFEFKSATLDIWVDFEDEHKAYLIEANGAWAWGMGGAGLFNWVEDDALIDKNDGSVVYFRYRKMYEGPERVIY